MSAVVDSELCENFLKVVMLGDFQRMLNHVGAQIYPLFEVFLNDFL